MTEEDKKELNLEIAEFAGFKEFAYDSTVTEIKPYTPTYWLYPDGWKYGKAPDFTDPVWGIAHLFQWVVPKLRTMKLKIRISCGDLSGKFHVHLVSWDKRYNRQSRPVINVYDKDNLALAFCLAIRELKSEVKV